MIQTVQKLLNMAMTLGATVRQYIVQMTTLPTITPSDIEVIILIVKITSITSTQDIIPPSLEDLYLLTIQLTLIPKV